MRRPAFHLGRHQLPIRRDEKDFLAVAPPARQRAAGKRDLSLPPGPETAR